MGVLTTCYITNKLRHGYRFLYLHSHNQRDRHFSNEQMKYYIVFDSKPTYFYICANKAYKNPRVPLSCIHTINPKVQTKIIILDNDLIHQQVIGKYVYIFKFIEYLISVSIPICTLNVIKTVLTHQNIVLTINV